MKSKLKKLKREAMPFFILFLIVDIVLVGAYIVAVQEYINEPFFEKMQGVLQNYFHTIITFGFVKAPFVNFFDFMNASFYTFIVFVLLFIAWKIKFSSTYDYEGIEHGSSDWAKNGEEFDKLDDGKEILNKKHGFILSKDHYLGTDLKKVAINKNVLVVGGSGAGKSACYIKPNILQCLGSYVITDPKGELYRETSGFLKANGYEVRAFNLVNPAYSDRYNPLAHIIDHTSVDIIAHTIVMGAKKEGGASNDPFWDDTAKMLLKACIYYVISVLPKEEQNLSSCMNIIRQGGADDKVFKRLFLDELKPSHPGRKEYENFSTAADKTMQSIIISTISKITAFDTPSMQKITTSNNINFDDLGRKKVALFVITSASDSTYDFISTIFFSQMLQKLYLQADHNGGTLNNQVYFLLDEFANIGQIPDFNKKLSTTRSLGISISIVVQSLDQLESLYKDSYENIIGNCDTQLFLGSQSLKTCEYFSKSLGQKTIKFRSKSVNKDKTETEKQGVSFSEQRQARDLMTVDELKRLNTNEEILLVRTLKPIRAKKAWYYLYHPKRDIIKQYEIHDITQMPKTDDVPIRTMDVKEHFAKIERIRKEYAQKNSKTIDKQMENMDLGVPKIKSVPTVKTPEKPNVNEKKDIEVDVSNVTGRDVQKIVEKKEEFDLQKELEKKFDELFGSTNTAD